MEGRNIPGQENGKGNRGRVLHLSLPDPEVFLLPLLLGAHVSHRQGPARKPKVAPKLIKDLRV